MSEVNPDQDFIDVMRTSHGRAVIRDILDMCGLDRSSFTNGQSNQTIFNEGKRRIGVDLRNRLIGADSDLYLLLVKEGLNL